MDGRVKTLHPMIPARARVRDNDAHLPRWRRRDRPDRPRRRNLYPFEATVASAPSAPRYENIDIAAVDVAPRRQESRFRRDRHDPADYPLARPVDEQAGPISLAPDWRQAYATTAPMTSPFQWFARVDQEETFPSGNRRRHAHHAAALRRDPHQRAALTPRPVPPRQASRRRSRCRARIELQQSQNVPMPRSSWVPSSATAATVVIVKHCHPCGVASAKRWPSPGQRRSPATASLRSAASSRSTKARRRDRRGRLPPSSTKWSSRRMPTRGPRNHAARRNVRLL